MSDNWQKLDKLEPHRKILESFIALMKDAILQEHANIEARLETMKKMGLVREENDDTSIEPKP